MIEESFAYVVIGVVLALIFLLAGFIIGYVAGIMTKFKNELT